MTSPVVDRTTLFKQVWEEPMIRLAKRSMSYPSQRVRPKERLLARAQLLRFRMGASVDFHEPLPPKPKGMHEWTYTKRGIRILDWNRRASSSPAFRSMPTFSGRIGLTEQSRAWKIS